MLQKYRITGMSCSACSAAVERAASKVEGVKEAQVNLLANTMLCEYDESVTDDEAVIKAVKDAGYGASVFVFGENVPQEKEEFTPIKTRLIASAILLVLLMSVSMGHMIHLPTPDIISMHTHPLNFTLIQLVLTLPVIYLNRKFYFSGFMALFKLHPNMDTLVALGSCASLLYGIVETVIIIYATAKGNSDLAHSTAQNLYFEGAAMILTLVTVGKFLEERSKKKTGTAIAKLVDLTPKNATVIRDGEEVVIPTEQVKKDDLVVIHPGESICVDGVIVSGASSVDEAAITGESIPVIKKVGDRVISASINQKGSFTMRAEKVGFETTLSKIIDLVESASATKAPVSKMADKIAGVFVPVVMGIAIITAVIWLIAGYGIPFAFKCAVSVLVISCPCALGLATPVAITVAVGRCAGKGILIKSAEAIENLSHIDTVVLDKTGTITNGRPSVVSAKLFEFDGNEFKKIACAIEKNSEHPLADAVVRYCEGFDGLNASEFSSVTGKGVKAVINGENYFAGTESYINSVGISTSDEQSYINEIKADGQTLVFFADSKKLIAILGAKDEIKATSIDAIAKMKELGLKIVMLTGDNEGAAALVSKQAGIDEFVAGVLPENKFEKIDELKSRGKKVAMIGDGINDSPALVRADVGIAIGNGTDIAIDSADIVLMNSDLNSAAEAIAYSRKTMVNIKENLFWAFFYNVICIPLAAGAYYHSFGITLSPMIAAAAMSLSSLFVVSNALRLYKK
ncbi:MAG TPA: heavy metal translocating P-type ATPase [Ruminococcaceae bacterium]|nr:heavy metal translocating P-type ATPase [Oscillospiraceae bacterium]